MPRKKVIVKEKSKKALRLPVLALRDIVVFPHMVIPLPIGRQITLNAIEDALKKDRLIALVAQKDPQVEEPTVEDLYSVGVLGRVAQLIKLPNGLSKVLVEGLMRMKVQEYKIMKGVIYAEVLPCEEEVKINPAIEAARRQLMSKFKEFVHLSRSIPDEVALSLERIESPRHIAYFVIIHLNRNVEQKQNLLEIDSVFDLLLVLTHELNREIEILKIEQNIEAKVKDKISKSQRNYYLQEQMRAIKKELGEEGEDDFSDVKEYKRIIKKAKLPKEVKAKAEEELKRLETTPMLSPEASVIRTYLDWLLGVPWYKATRDNRDIELARKILDEDHYGLEKPKERILEHLAVLAKTDGKMRGPILCFIGPPGVGKTSLGKSIARALGRNFVRISLGGVRDEAEIRGHRRTYIGALPGRIIQSMKKAGTINPVFLLDEVDKMSTDFRGDPSAALLEVLDPEQNRAFSDHYLEVDYNLSQVMFITTANTREGIPWPLLDRMEIIHLPGYLHQEKFEIAQRFLIPKQMAECGLSKGEIEIAPGVIDLIIERYTREAGVRELERCIAKIMRKAAREILAREKSAKKESQADKAYKPLKIGVRQIQKYLGVAPYESPNVDRQPRVGVAIGLAWNPTGGDIMSIEAEIMRGKGILTLTGQLGDVMQESARAALTTIRARAEKIGFDPDQFMKQEVHIHVPENAVPKDGPSAGIAIAMAVASAFSGRPLRGDIAMTGEITLRGEVLPIGGLREKLMAAVRANIENVIIPERNKRELSEVPHAVLKPLKIITVKNIDEVLDLVLLPGEKRNRKTAKQEIIPATATVY